MCTKIPREMFSTGCQILWAGVFGPTEKDRYLCWEMISEEWPIKLSQTIVPLRHIIGAETDCTFYSLLLQNKPFSNTKSTNKFQNRLIQFMKNSK